MLDPGAAAQRTINHVPAMLAYWTREQRCLFADASYREWFGREPSEMQGITLRELLGPLYELNRPYIEGALSGVPQQFERAITLPNGTVRHSTASYTPDIIDGEVMGFTALVTDVTTLHEREEPLRLATELLDRTGELARVGGAELILSTNEVFWTREMFRILDLEPGAVPPVERWVDFFEDDALQRYLAASQDMRSREMSLDMVTPMITAKGRRIMVHIQASSIVENGKVVKLVATHQDVTEQHRADEARRESEGFTIGVLDSIQDQVAVLDAHGIIVAVNDAWRRSAVENGSNALVTEGMGLDYLGVLDRSASDGELDAQEAAAGIRDVIEERSPTCILEYPCPKADGLHWFQMRVVPYIGPRRGVVVSHRDITAQRKDDQERRLSDAALRAVTEGVVITDLERRVVWMNDAITTITGYARQEMLGKTMQLLQGALTSPETIVEMRRAVQAHTAFAGEVCNYRRDGTPFWNELTLAPMHDAHGGVTHFVGVVRDVTARHDAALEFARLQEALQHAQKLESIGRLAGGVAHDFNNMLSAIMGHADFALNRLQNGETPTDDIESIQAAAQRSADLTRQLLAFARRQVITPRAVDVNDAVTRSIAMLERLLGEDISVVWRPQEDLWPAHLDPTQFDQVLTNLCLNARDAIEGVGRIEIDACNVEVDAAMAAAHEGAHPGSFVRLRVHDDGSGMDAETMAHIFEPFYTTKPHGTGTGLGLATVYGAVRQSDGFIVVRSAPGEGSEFAVFLPRSPEAVVLPMTEAPVPANIGGNETLLVVEDEPALLELTTRMLQQHGYRVLAATLPTDALRIAAEHKGAIDLLLTDVIMPRMTGRELAAVLQGANPTLECVYISGYPADVDAGRALVGEEVHFLQKPCPEAVLLRMVRDVLDRRPSAK